MSNTTDTAAPVRAYVRFAAIDPYVEKTIISPEAKKATASGDRYLWGDRDLYPGYLLELYDNVTTLRSVIDGCVDYIAGDDVTFQGSSTAKMNSMGESPQEIVRQCAHNLKTYGGFALEVIRAKDGSVAEVYCIDLRFLRTNKANDVFWYSEKWGKANPKPDVLPAFMPEVKDKWAAMTEEERNEHAASIVWVKMDQGGVYPAPPYAAAVKACETERKIGDFHLNNLRNGFMGPVIINFNNGLPGPGDTEMEEIERNVYEKWTGTENAGRPILSWNANKESAATIESVKIEDFGARYDALAKRSRQEIFTAFRANPNLFGIPTESLGFSSEEYESAFKLFNRTQIRPCQRKIADAFVRIYGAEVLDIVPFNIETSGETVVD